MTDTTDWGSAADEVVVSLCSQVWSLRNASVVAEFTGCRHSVQK